MKEKKKERKQDRYGKQYPWQHDFNARCTNIDFTIYDAKDECIAECMRGMFTCDERCHYCLPF